MGMGQKKGIYLADVSAQGLRAEIWAYVDEKVFARAVFGCELDIS